MKKTLIFKYGDLLDVSVETFGNIQSAIMETTYGGGGKQSTPHAECDPLAGTLRRQTAFIPRLLQSSPLNHKRAMSGGFAVAPPGVLPHETRRRAKIGSRTLSNNALMDVAW